VYAYAFGELLVLALYTRYRDTGEAFPPLYLDLLAAGGSAWPEELLKPLGVDLKDPGFWAQGLSMLEEMVRQAEELAGSAE
jgi:oligoendopeptidase F